MKEKKERNTRTKQLVVEVFKKNHSPLGLEDIFKRVVRAHPKTAYSTVYRIIKKLEDARHVIKTDWKDRGSRYEWADRPHHHHIVCEECDSVVDINDKVLNFNEKNIMRNTGFIINNHTIEITGVCAPCQKNK